MPQLTIKLTREMDGVRGIHRQSADLLKAALYTVDFPADAMGKIYLPDGGTMVVSVEGGEG